MPLRPPAGYIRPGYDPLKVPDAPTIGTASSSSITFTAPSNPGGSAITMYYAVATDSSSGAKFTGSGTTSPITVSGLTTGSTYTYRVYAVNSYGPSVYSSASNSTVKAPEIGDAFGGGYYAGNIVQGGTTYRVIVAPKASGSSSSYMYWKTSNSAGPTATITLNNGKAASAAMNSSSYPPAQFCEGLSIGGYTDWYLPSRDELELCYRNLKPTTDQNYTLENRVSSSYTYPEGNDGSDDYMGRNRNSSPAGFGYTTYSPSQTSIVVFKSGNSESFEYRAYWSSSEFSATRAWRQDFGGGGQTGVVKDEFGVYCRAVRRVAV